MIYIYTHTYIHIQGLATNTVARTRTNIRHELGYKHNIPLPEHKQEQPHIQTRTQMQHGHILRVIICVALTCSSCMIMRYDHHIWWPYVIIINDHHIWSSYMIFIYDHHRWQSDRIMIYGHRIWWSDMIMIYDDHLWSSFMIITYDHPNDHHIYIYTHHIWWSSYVMII